MPERAGHFAVGNPLLRMAACSACSFSVILFVSRTSFSASFSNFASWCHSPATTAAILMLKSFTDVLHRCAPVLPFTTQAQYEYVLCC